MTAPLEQRINRCLLDKLDELESSVVELQQRNALLSQERNAYQEAAERACDDRDKAREYLNMYAEREAHLRSIILQVALQRFPSKTKHEIIDELDRTVPVIDCSSVM